MKKYINLAMSLIVAISIVSCSGDDGLDGVIGESGANATDGANGADGTDGLGFEEITEQGFIKVTFTGTRPDDVAFTNEQEFKYRPYEAYDVINYSSVFYSDNDQDLEFDIIRYFSAPDNVYGSNAVRFELFVDDNGLPSQSFSDFEISFEDLFFLFDDGKIMEFDQSYDNTDLGVSNFVISNYSYDFTKKNLKYSFSFDVGGAYNTTGNDLNIQGEVDIIATEYNNSAI